MKLSLSPHTSSNWCTYNFYYYNNSSNNSSNNNHNHNHTTSNTHCNSYVPAGLLTVSFNMDRWIKLSASFLRDYQRPWQSCSLLQSILQPSELHNLHSCNLSPVASQQDGQFKKVVEVVRAAIVRMACHDDLPGSQCEKMLFRGGKMQILLCDCYHFPICETNPPSRTHSALLQPNHLSPLGIQPRGLNQAVEQSPSTDCRLIRE